MTGVIVSVEDNKKKGLIEADDGTRAHIHKDQVIEGIFRRGARVEFEIQPRKPRAVNVKVIS